jgi:hypothetical protein
MDIQSLLNEISTHRASKLSDAQLQGIEVSRKKNTDWTKERFLPIWEQAEQNNLSFTEIKKKYEISFYGYKNCAKRYNLPIKERPKNPINTTTRTTKSLNKPYNQDIINGMSRKVWAIKYGKSVDIYDTQKSRLRKKGLL